MCVSFYTQKFVVSVTRSKNLVACYKFVDSTVGPIFKIFLLNTDSFLGCFIKNCYFKNLLYMNLHWSTRPIDPTEKVPHFERIKQHNQFSNFCFVDHAP